MNIFVIEYLRDSAECDEIMDNLSKIKNLLKKDQRGLNIREISEILKINRNSVAKLLDILTAKEEVEIRVHGRSKVYYLAKPQDYRKWFELLSRTVEELNNFPPDGDIYAFIAGTLKHITPEDTIILVNSFDQDTKTITLHAVEGLRPRQPDVEAILCRPLNGLAFSVPDRVLPEMLTGECNEILGGLTELTFGRLPYETCKKIEAMPFFGKVYSVGISWRGRLNGAATFILPQGTELENHDLITFFIRQVAGFLSRREAETALKESEQFTREIIDNAKEGVVVYDRNFNYLVWNPFMESLTGFSASETLGKNGFDLFPHLREQKVEILLQRALAGETVRSLDIPYHVPQTKKSGWVSGIYSPHFNGQGEIVGVIGNIRDITERKRAEEVLRESEQQFRMLLSQMPDIVMVHKDGIIVYANQMAVDKTGFTQQELIGSHVLDYVVADDRQTVIKNMVRRAAGEWVDDYEIDMVHKSGALHHVIARTSPIVFNHIPSVVLILIDITERKRAEEVLRESESYLNSILHGSPVPQFVLDKNHHVISWNKAIEEYSGVKEAEVLGTRDQWKAFYDAERPVLADLMIDEAAEKLPELYPGKFNKSPFVEGAYEVTDFFPKMGTRGVWLHFTTAPIRDVKGAIIGAVETLEDITERKRAEEEIKQTRHNYETFFNTIDEFLFVLDEQGRILHTNETVIRRFGYTRQELLGEPVLMLHPPERRDESKRIVQELVAGTMNFCPLPLMTKDGHLIPVESRVTKGEWDGRPVLFGVCKDLSELKISEEKFSAAFHSSAALMAISTKQDGKFIDVNETFLATLGFSRDEVIGKRVSELDLFMHPEDRLHAIRMHEERGMVRNLEVPIHTKDGSVQYGLFSVDSIMIGEVPCLLTTMVDITEQKILEKEMEFHEQEIMRFSRSLDAAIRKLNLLSSITRHDINNQLTVILGYLDMLESKQHDPTLNAYLRSVATAAQRISTMIQFTKIYESIGAIAPIWQDIRTLVNTAAKEAPLGQVILKNDLPAGAEVFADPLIVKVFYNLMDNAVRYGGKITTIWFSVDRQDGGPVIVCEDDGNGVPAEEKEKIFERGYGKNTGFGLFLAREILDITGITIRETGEPGKGARFEITVPKGAYRFTGVQ